ncbi:hypothetical protein UP09_34755 [Bradyrhizobium sp. LTSP885]|nr:hypothetical protein [Bradyrhizobium sp. LTSP885]KJC33883.1 hypothetical protein UP09_34755 [Bradyrhizobium sp. LTSP885]
MSVDDRQDAGAGLHRSSPTGPRTAPPLQVPPRDAPPLDARVQPLHGIFRPSLWSVAFFVLLLSGVGIRAYRDLSQPGAWEYWRESHGSPTMTSSVIPSINIDGRKRRVLTIEGEIGAASASWFHDRLEEAHLSDGDLVLLSSPGGLVDQAAIIGETIRARGLFTAVGTADASGKVRPAICASACVLIFAGGEDRYGIRGSMLGVHRFRVPKPTDDPVAETQRSQGLLLGYMTGMGVSSSIVEAMSQTSEIRWLTEKEALAMNLITTVLAYR